MAAGSARGSVTVSAHGRAMCCSPIGGLTTCSSPVFTAAPPWQGFGAAGFYGLATFAARAASGPASPHAGTFQWRLMISHPEFGPECSFETKFIDVITAMFVMLQARPALRRCGECAAWQQPAARLAQAARCERCPARSHTVCLRQQLHSDVPADIQPELIPAFRQCTTCNYMQAVHRGIAAGLSDSTAKRLAAWLGVTSGWVASMVGMLQRWQSLCCHPTCTCLKWTACGGRPGIVDKPAHYGAVVM